MALAMSRPWKHPKTGIYWFRKRVPDELRVLLGKTEEKQSLGTRDPSEAKLKQAEVLVAVEKRWANLRIGPRSLSEREASEFARSAHDTWLARSRDNPSEQPWPVALGDKLFPAEPSIWADRPPIDLAALDADAGKIQELEAWCLREADIGLAERGLKVDDASRVKYAKAIASAVQRASVMLAELAKGYPCHGPSAGLSNGAAPMQAVAAKKVVRLDDILKGWAAEKRPGQRTLYNWTRIIRKLEKTLKHDDAARITPDELLLWKKSLIAAGFQPKTIRDSNLAPVRAILQWAVDNRLLSSNPAERLTMDVTTKAAESRRGYTDDEAKIVLKAAQAEKDMVLRWVPWLCAYSGARVAEICQLRAEDIVQIDGIWCLKIDPEAGSIKTAGSERAVPLHPALIDTGFLTFAGTIKKGPLFPKLPADRFGSRGGNGTRIIGKWVRLLGIEDKRLASSHSWRHRLKTLGRRHGLAPDIVDAMTGHRGRTVADSYGEFPMEALHREISKIPTLKLS